MESPWRVGVTLQGLATLPRKGKLGFAAADKTQTGQTSTYQEDRGGLRCGRRRVGHGRRIRKRATIGLVQGQRQTGERRSQRRYGVIQISGDIKPHYCPVNS